MDCGLLILTKYTNFSLFGALFGPFLTTADPLNAPEKGQKIKTMKKNYWSHDSDDKTYNITNFHLKNSLFRGVGIF